jgi:hypothetical protein
LAGRLVETRALERLGFARLGDYARERLGLSARKLHELARIDRVLADLPRLEASLRWNVLPWCKIRLIARIATPETVDAWIERARTLPTRALERAVREQARGTALDLDLAAEDPERQRWIQLHCSPAVRVKWSLARELAERVAGQRLGNGEALELVAAECFSTFSIDPELVRLADPPRKPGGERQARADPRRSAVLGDCAGGAPGTKRPEPSPDASQRGHGEWEDEWGDEWGEWKEVSALLRELEEADAFELDRRLRRAIHLEQTLDATIAPLLRRLRDGERNGQRQRGQSEQEGQKEHGSRPGLSSSTCEGLGMSARKVRSLLRLERAGDVCPELRRAYRAGELSWVKAQCLLPLLLLDAAGDGQPGNRPGGGEPDGPCDVASDVAPDGDGDGDGDNDDQGRWQAAWVAWAQRVTVRRLTEDIERALVLGAVDRNAWLRCKDHPERVRDPIPPDPTPPEERQLCAPGVGAEGSPEKIPEETERLRWWVPVEVALLFAGVRETLRRRLEVEKGRRVSDGEVFEGLLDEALRSWTLREPGVRRPDPVIERDGYRCAVPGCSSRRNLQNHHIIFRSAGGSHEAWNRVTLCAFHHQRGVHAGRIGVRGRAPERLGFKLGLRGKGARPLVGYRSGDGVTTMC